MEELKRSRQCIKGSITRIQSAFSQDIPLCEMKVRVDRLEQLFENFENIQGKIESLTEVDHLVEEEQYRANIEDKYFSIKTVFASRQQEEEIENTVLETPNHSELSTAMKTLVDHQSKMSQLIEQLSSNARFEPSVVANTIEQNHYEIRLPQIQIPEFDGEFINWIRFRDLFEALVHNKANLSNIEKLEYLQTKLKGDALSLIKHLKPTGDNYMVAWELLKKRFDRTDKIKNSYLEILFVQTSMKNGSVSEFKRFCNTIIECINALKGLNEPVSQWDSILLFVLEKKLDSESARLWFRTKKPDQTTTFSDFMQFMEERLFELESAHDVAEPKQQSKQSGKNHSNVFATNQLSCPVCTKSHLLFYCEKFKSFDVGERIKVVKTNNLCFNCLQSNHLASECKSSSCRVCKSRHNTLLHIQTSSEAQLTTAQQNSSNQSQTTPPLESSLQVHSTHQKAQSITILPTAVVMVYDFSGTLQPCRALLDSGAEATLITETCVQRLQLQRKFDKTLLYGVSSSTGTYTKGKVKLHLSSNGGSIVTDAFCLTKLTHAIPRTSISKEKLKFFENLELADPEFNIPHQVDIILSTDIFFELLLHEQIVHPSGSLRAIRTTVGWVITGKVDDSFTGSIVVAHNTTIQLSDQLERFWDLEDIKEQTSPFTPEEEQAEKHFQANVQRHENGRYIVRLPVKENDFELGDSRTMAFKRLKGMENKFKNNSNLYSEYKAFIDEYIQLDHMEISNNSSNQTSYFMPHHAVLKPSSTTTKLRVVFDASCKSSNGVSLNDHLLIGPTVQKDLFDILIQFRKFKIGFSADIEKMYRQVLVYEDDQPLQQILWRDTDADEPKSYKLKTVTYGTSCAPFLATRTLLQVALDNSKDFPEACKVITDSFYVDDLMACAPELDIACKITNECSKILGQAGFHLRKWSSNSLLLKTQLDPENSDSVSRTISDDSRTVKTLGLLWDTESDSFGYTVCLSEPQGYLTKRQVLSDICKIFDPLGWLAPVVISLKIFMQTLWLTGVSWDEALSDNLREQWLSLRNNIKIIPLLKIPRWLMLQANSEPTLCGFSDASELAYSAVIYLKVNHADGTILTNIVAAKTRVAPVKQISLPRLELCGAQLLTKLMSKVQNALSLDNVAKEAYTDSTIVLAWLSDHPRRWKTFVANRTSYIMNSIPTQFWNHIPSEQNPADLATRGITASELLDNELWWHGPNILKTDHAQKHSITIPDNVDLEERKQTTTYVVSMQEPDFISRFSDFNKLIRITAYLLRFARNTKLEKKDRSLHFLTTSELNSAHDTLVRMTQLQSFSSEITVLLKGKQLSNSHKLSALAPFIDKNGLLRVGGRIENADIPYNQKHPLIIDNKSHLCELIVRDCHLKNMHAGKRHLQYIIGLRYWVPSIQPVLKRCIYKCTKCMRFRNKTFQQQMGNIPSCRLQIAPAFTNTGVDFAGPVQVKSWKGRGSRLYKSWIAVFVCLTTKAIHLELVSELSSAAFIASLRRFVARRGKPTNMYSDNGTNFSGCHQHFRTLREFLSSKTNQESIFKESTYQQINWHFSPPSAPHFGGMFEAGVKSMKYHLKRTLMESSLTFEELYTTLCQIEACLNSRPICLKFDGDLDPLTPGHFLIFRAVNSIPDEDFSDVKINSLTRWQYLQRIVQQFWKKWSTQYISQLQQRPKWKQKLNNLKIDDVVLIKEENLPPTSWSMGRIVQTHPGADGLVRVVTVKTSKGIYKRPIVKLCPLFVNFESGDFQGGRYV